jgi:outer membrane protein OmpA-like peptidoglycan-associated protein
MDRPPPISALLLPLLLSACAATPPAVQDDALAHRVAELEARLAAQGQSGSALVGELARKVEGLTGLQDRLTGQARQEADQRDQQAARLAALQRQLEEVIGWSRQVASAAKTAQADAALASRIDALEGQVRQAKVMVERMDRIGTGLTGEGRQNQAELTMLNERLHQADQRLAQLAGQVAAEAAEAARTRSGLEAAGRSNEQATARETELTTRLTRLEQKVAELSAQVDQALELAGYGQRKIYGKALYQIVLTQDKTLFPLNSPDLGDQDIAQLDALVPRLKELGTNYHLHIEGHTDGIGPEDYNYQLGKARAEVVKRYLNERWGIPLLRMSVTSHGATAKAPGQPSRRIVVQVLQ